MSHHKTKKGSRCGGLKKSLILLSHTDTNAHFSLNYFKNSDLIKVPFLISKSIPKVPLMTLKTEIVSSGQKYSLFFYIVDYVIKLKRPVH